MIRSAFENQLHALNTNLILMGSLCEEIISKSLMPISENDQYLVNDVGKTYQKIEQMERDIESQCLKLLLRQQPVAKDLRRISAALKMVYDMKRIGAQSAEIFDIIGYGHVHEGAEFRHLKQMVKHVVHMVTDSVDAFVHDDETLALKVIQKDVTVDKEFDTIKASLIAHIAELGNDGEYTIDVLMIAKYLERIGDHTVNVAKWVIFSITGELNGEET